MLKQLPLIPVLIALLTVMQGCKDNIPAACTLELNISYLDVLEPGGAPADSVDITVTRAFTGDTLEICDGYDSICGSTPQGKYVIMHDFFAPVLSEQGEYINVTGQKDSLSFDASFIFSGGACHILKIKGPATVTLTP